MFNPEMPVITPCKKLLVIEVYVICTRLPIAYALDLLTVKVLLPVDSVNELEDVTS